MILRRGKGSRVLCLHPRDYWRHNHDHPQPTRSVQLRNLNSFSLSHRGLLRSCHHQLNPRNHSSGGFEEGRSIALGHRPDRCWLRWRRDWWLTRHDRRCPRSPISSRLRNSYGFRFLPGASDFIVPEAVNCMIVYHSDGLHECVADC